MIDRYSKATGPSMQRYRTHSWRPGDREKDPDRTGSRGWQGVALWVGLTAAAAVVGSMAPGQADTFYGALQKPVWAPPAWLFGPVWTLLYVLMATAAVMVHRRLGSGPLAGRALRLYALALVPNALWSWTFFHWHLGQVSMAVIVILWLLLVATVLVFRQVRPAAAALMVPVTLWVSFAGVLNLALLRMNAGIL